MAKRGATTELNHDNWDSVDDKEDAGSFTPCSATELQSRVIRKAKRSLTNSSGSSNSPGMTPFSKFTGFSGAASPFGSAKTDVSNFKSPFSSSAKTDASNFKSPFGSSTKTDVPSFNSPFSATVKKEEKPNGTTASNSQDRSSGDTKPSLSDAKPVEKESRNLEYYKQLQSLNVSILKWMQLHIEKNPCCDFTPVFNDYKKHMDTLSVTYPAKTKETSSASEKKQSLTSSSTAEVSKESSGSSNDNSNFKKEKHEDETDYGANFKSNTTNTSTFSFGSKSMPTPTSSVSSIGCTSSSKEGNDPGDVANFKSNTTNTSTSSFGIKSTPNTTSSVSSSGCTSSSKEGNESGNEEKKTQAPFSFGYFSKAANQPNSDKPFSFACTPVTKSSGVESLAENEEAEYVPPKNEFVAVSEEDAFYSKRCKLFFKKGESYADRGVGNLYLKPMDGKTQLLIRADTSLGNILLNIMLSASLPMSRTGKNNVLLVCIPNPPIDAKKADSKEAIPMLIRVKTSEEADELLETLNKHKS